MSNLINILEQAFHQEASDIHFRSGEAVWFRVHGKVSPKPEFGASFSHDDLMKNFMEIVPAEKQKYFDEKLEVDFSYQLADLARFRVNIYLGLGGICACFRILPSEVMNVNDLSIEPGILELCTKSKGLILVTGPTGSGKSTTLAAMIDYINLVRSDHIITIEDPIEFLHKEKSCLINQREITTHTKGFNQALRAALREDPDIVMVGEMRDLETTMTALEVAETGHLVLATLHTNSAASTVYRIINQFPKKKQEQVRIALASSLIGVVSQTLVPKAHEPGRVGVREIMIVNHAVANLIRENKVHQIESVLQMGRKKGMVKMDDALVALVEEGTITAKDALSKSPDPNSFKKSLELRNLL